MTTPSPDSSTGAGALDPSQRRRFDPLFWRVFGAQRRIIRAQVGGRLRAREGAPLEPTHPTWAIVLVAAVYLPLARGGAWVAEHTGSPAATFAFHLALLAIVGLPALAHRGLVDRPVTLGRHHWRAGAITYFADFVVTLVVALALHPLIPPEADRPLGDRAPLLTLLSVTVIGPITEELMFRGWILGALRRRLRLGGAVVVSSVLFGLAHLFVYGGNGMAQTAAGGFVYGTAAILTGSLVPSIAAHSLNNLGVTATTEGFSWFAFLMLAAAIVITYRTIRTGWRHQRLAVIPQECADDETWFKTTAIVSDVADRLELHPPVVDIARSGDTARFSPGQGTITVKRTDADNFPRGRLEVAIGAELARHQNRWRFAITATAITAGAVLLYIGLFVLINQPSDGWLLATIVIATIATLTIELVAAASRRRLDRAADDRVADVLGARALAEHLRLCIDQQTRRQRQLAQVCRPFALTDPLADRIERMTGEQASSGDRSVLERSSP